MRLPSRILPAALVAAGLSGFASAETLTAVPDQPLQALLDRAHDGDVVELAPGEYNGSIRIDRPLVLTGRPGAVLDGGGAGNVITVTAPDVAVRGVTVRGSGRDLQAMNSGIFLQKTAERATIENNRLVGNLFGDLRAWRRGIAGRPQRDRRPARRPAQRGRQRRLALERARCHHCGQHLPLRSRRHLHDFQPQGPLRRTTASSRSASRSTTCTPTTAR